MDDEFVLTMDKIRDIKGRLQVKNPEYIERFDELVELRGNLLEYVDAIEASIEGYDPDDWHGMESSFGDSVMEDTIRLLRTLPTIPADMSNYVGDDWEGWKQMGKGGGIDNSAG